MQSLSFYKVSPGGNATLLVLDPVPAPDRAAVARTLMDAGHVQAEQVGYLDLSARPVRLDMMGDEFCGNACRAAVAVMVREQVGLDRAGQEYSGLLSVSGAAAPVPVRAVAGPDGPDGLDQLECWVRMPGPARCEECGPGQTVVHLPGIVHLCLDQALHPVPENPDSASRALRREFCLDAEAVGCIWYTGAPCRITPVVWVRATDSTCLETGCGSGSLAVALCLGHQPPFGQSVLQPSGQTIGVHVDAHSEAWIFGPVNLVARGEAYL